MDANPLLTPPKPTNPPVRLYYTPQTRLRRKGSVSTSIKTALKQVIVTKEPECLVSCSSEPLQVAHVLDRATKAKTLTELERAWGVKHIHLDSRFNLMHLDLTIHWLYDKFQWTIVPSMELLHQIQGMCDAERNLQARLRILPSNPQYKPLSYRETFPVGDQKNPKSYEYHMITFPPMLHVSTSKIFRSFSSTNSEARDTEVQAGAPCEYNIVSQGCLYKAPFAAFPVLFSHVHPYFVICKAYYAFSFHDRKGDLPSHLRDHWDLLRSIYRHWAPEAAEASAAGPGKEDDHLDDKSPDELPDDGSSDEDGKREDDIGEEDEEGGQFDSFEHESPTHREGLPDLGDGTSDCSDSMEEVYLMDIPYWSSCVSDWCDGEEDQDRRKDMKGHLDFVDVEETSQIIATQCLI